MAGMGASAAVRTERSAFADVYRILRRHRGPAGWWPGGVAVRGLRRRHPRPEHGLVERREGDRRAARGGPAVVRGAGRVCRWGAGGAHPPVRLPHREGAAPGRVRRLPRARVRRAASRRWPAAIRSPSAPQLLAVHGIGRETADSIALYAAGLPLFVIDAYTRRVFSRLGLVAGDEPYDTLQRRFMDALAARRRALQRLPRADRRPRQGRLPEASAVRPLSAVPALSPDRSCALTLRIAALVVLVSLARVDGPHARRRRSGRTGATARRR